MDGKWRLDFECVAGAGARGFLVGDLCGVFVECLGLCDIFASLRDEKEDEYEDSIWAVLNNGDLGNLSGAEFDF